VVVKIVSAPGPASSSSEESNVVEICGGRIRVGEERTQFQEFLYNWFYTCATIGTLHIAALYVILWHGFKALWRYLHCRYFEENEPPCDLDMDDEDDVGVYADVAGDESVASALENESGESHAAPNRSNGRSRQAAEYVERGFNGDGTTSDQWEDLPDSPDGTPPVVVERDEEEFDNGEPPTDASAD